MFCVRIFWARIVRNLWFACDLSFRWTHMSVLFSHFVIKLMLHLRKVKTSAHQVISSHVTPIENWKSVFEHAQNAQIQIHPAHVQSHIRLFALNWYLLWCQMILLADSEGPDQTARTRSLIWAFAVLICPKTGFSHGEAQLSTQRPDNDALA